MKNYTGLLGYELAALALVALVSACPGDDSAGSDGGADTAAESTSGNNDDTASDGTTPPATSSATDSSDGGSTAANDDDSTGDSTGPGDPDDSSGTEAIGGAIPDPGPGMDAWTSMGAIDSPANAWPVGIATQQMPYIEGMTADDGNAFFVFEAGPALTQLDIFAFGELVPDFIHLHDGTGLEFGEAIAPDSVGLAEAHFTTTPGNIYVLEIHFPGAGFF